MGSARATALHEHGYRGQYPAALSSLRPVPAVPSQHCLLGGPLLPAGHARRERARATTLVASALANPARPEAQAQVLPPVHQWAVGVRPEQLTHLTAHPPTHFEAEFNATGKLDALEPDPLQLARHWSGWNEPALLMSESWLEAACESLKTE